MEAYVDVIHSPGGATDGRDTRPEVTMSAAKPRPADRFDDSFEARWARWRAEAAAQDSLWRRGVLAVAVLAGCALAAWLGAGAYFR